MTYVILILESKINYIRERQYEQSKLLQLENAIYK